MNSGYRRFPLDLSSIRRFLRRLVKATDGVESIEFALVAIPLFLFLFGIVEFGRLYWTQSELQYAAEAAARYVTINPTATNSTVKAYAATKVYGISAAPNISDLSVTTTAACGNQVSFNYTFNFIVGSLFPYGPIILSTTACHQA